MKGKSIGFYCNILAVIAEIIGIVCFTIMGQDGQGLPSVVYVLSVAGAVLQIAAVAIVVKKGDSRILDLAGIVIAVLYAAALVLMIKARVGVIVTIFANHVGVVGMPFVLTTAAFLVAVLAQMIAGFLPMEKN